MSIRKDKYVRVNTTAGTLYGKVLGVDGDALNIATASGSARVNRADAVKITAAEYKSSDAIAATAAAFNNTQADSVVRPAVKDNVGSVVKPNAEIGPAVRMSIFEYNAPSVKAPKRAKKAASGVSRPAKGEGKKRDALAIYAELTNEGVPPARKAFIAAVVERAGLTAKGASTYYYNIKSGRWA